VPTYDYQCRNCGNTTEVIHSMLEEGPTACEICGGPLRRVLYPAGIIFKGSGFYKTDSRSSTSSSIGSSGAKEAAKPASGTADGSAASNGSATGSSKKTDAGGASKAATGDSSTASH
jgi:putative FmdB family regulatory protein